MLLQLFLSVEMQKERGGGGERGASKEADTRRYTQQETGGSEGVPATNFTPGCCLSLNLQVMGGSLVVDISGTW